MADSKSQKKNDNKPVVKKPNKIQKWWRETVGELRKVTWPTRKETTATGIAVLVLVFVMSLFLGVVDLGLTKLVEYILS